ncbi:MAG: hypothetical protein OXU39_01405 [Gemmatimonadota bacterium]|nr:hypothetical protein [Gemmatimonadota bacterium]MDE3004726.1 hypothetical protein [Gemmatimonadota bacterium]
MKQAHHQAHRLHRVFFVSLLTICLCSASSLEAQMAEPTNMMVMDKYDIGGAGPVFAEYFEMVQRIYEGETSAASSWGIYWESPTVRYRLAAVPEAGLNGVLELMSDRTAKADAFSSDDQELFGAAWEGRQTTVWAELGSLNYMPENWDYETVSGNPFHAVRVVYIKQGEQENFERAVQRMNELNRSVGINDLMMRVFRGALGTDAPVYMFRSASESMEAHGRKNSAHRAAREAIIDQWQENNRLMMSMYRHVDQFSNFRVDRLSRAPANR